MTNAPANLGEPILQARGLAKSFLGLQALQDFSASVRPGEILGIIGPNGAGKTTCFNLLTGFLAPTAGRIEFTVGGRKYRGRCADAPSHLAVGDIDQRAGISPERGRGEGARPRIPRLFRPHAVRRAAGGQPALRFPAPGGDCAGDGNAPVAVAVGRTGGRNEPGGERRSPPAHSRPSNALRADHPAGRTRYASGDESVRAHHRAELRRDHRSGQTRRGARRPAGDRGLSWRRPLGGRGQRRPNRRDRCLSCGTLRSITAASALFEACR
ncbi:MAG: ATP-binding cassette domain-containing protein [Chloroflexi bacterium]|nr:ATP-binding cassette domain-containing protein [Chloroflexota bacterium]